MTICLVTGGSGYLGSRFVQRLHDLGHEVRVLDLLDADDRPAGVELVLGDIRDPAVVRAAVDGVEVVYHNVAQVPLARDPDLLLTVNVDGTRVLLDAARDAGVRKVVHTSSSAVFGVPRINPVLPHSVPHPMEAYGHAKLEAEWACLAAAAEGFDVSIVRPRTILGHGRLGIFGILFDWIADGADPVVLGDGRNRYQFVHADDLFEACRREAEQDGPAVLNVGGPQVRTMAEMLTALCDHARTGSTVRRLPARPTALAMRVGSRLGLLPFAPYHWLMYAESMWFDLDHLGERLGWAPERGTDDMFRESYDWFCAHRHERTATNASHHRRSARQGALSLAKHLTRLATRA